MKRVWLFMMRDVYQRQGFINLFGLSIKERAKLSKNWPEVK